MESLALLDVDNAVLTTSLTLDPAAPGSSDDITLRIYNASTLYQAEDVTVTVTGDDAVQLWLSADGDTFAATLAIGDVPPASTSTPFWLRRVTASTQPTGTCSAAITATPTGWTHPVDNTTSINIPLDTED